MCLDNISQSIDFQRSVSKGVSLVSMLFGMENLYKYSANENGNERVSSRR